MLKPTHSCRERIERATKSICKLSWLFQTLLAERLHRSLEVVQLFFHVLWVIEPEALASLSKPQ